MNYHQQRQLIKQPKCTIKLKKVKMENKALNIKALRQKAKLSVQQLSDKTGISAGWLYSMENGVMSDYPCDNVLQVSAESLGCSAIDLLAADSKDK